MTPRKFCDSARSGWRASIASRSFNASKELLASNSRKALSYIASSSDFEGATLLAAKELNTKTAITPIFRIFIPAFIQPLPDLDDKPKIGRRKRFFSSRIVQIALPTPASHPAVLDPGPKIDIVPLRLLP